MARVNAEPIEARELRLRELAAEKRMTFQRMQTNKSGQHLYWVVPVSGVVINLSADAKTVEIGVDGLLAEVGTLSILSTTSLDNAEAYLETGLVLPGQ
jgi:hypothetical protein